MYAFSARKVEGMGMTWWLFVGLILGLILWWMGHKVWEAYRLHRRVLLEDALKVLMDCNEQGLACTLDTLTARLRLSPTQAVRLARVLTQQGLARMAGARLELTPEGRALALHILRAHRLWERYLRDYTDLSLADIHRMADRMEHHLTPREVRRLAATLGHPRRDPHGDVIPRENEEPRVPGTPLTRWPVGKPARIVHVEDEPVSVFEQILAEDLLPGTRLEVLEASPQGIHLRVLEDGREVWLAGVVAANIHVAPVERPPQVPARPPLTLDRVPLRQKVRVVGLSPRLRGLLRRRLLDLGFTPGAVVEPVMESTFGRGDPRAYRVRGTLVALRREQAEHILVEPLALEETPEPASAEPSTAS